MVNINIELPEDLHKKLKVQALMNDKPIKDYFIEILEKHAKP